MNKCWQIYQIRLVYIQKSCIMVQIFPKKAKFGQIVSFPRLFTPTCKYLYTNIFVIFVTFRNSALIFISTKGRSSHCTVMVLWERIIFWHMNYVWYVLFLNVYSRFQLINRKYAFCANIQFCTVIVIFAKNDMFNIYNTTSSLQRIVFV